MGLCLVSSELSERRRGGRTDAAFYESSSSFVERLEMYRDQRAVNKFSLAEKMGICLLYNERQSALFVFLCVFLTSAAGASSV